MKRVLNLNHQGAQIIVLIIMFGLLIPGVLWLLGTLFVGQMGLLHRLIYASLIIGGLLLVGFVVLLILEQIQDHLLYRTYQKSLGKRIPLAGGAAECPYCGCRRVQDYESACPVCHKTLT